MVVPHYQRFHGLRFPMVNRGAAQKVYGNWTLRTCSRRSPCVTATSEAFGPGASSQEEGCMRGGKVR